MTYKYLDDRKIFTPIPGDPSFVVIESDTMGYCPLDASVRNPFDYTLVTQTDTMGYCPLDSSVRNPLTTPP